MTRNVALTLGLVPLLAFVFAAPASAQGEAKEPDDWQLEFKLSAGINTLLQGDIDLETPGIGRRRGIGRYESGLAYSGAVGVRFLDDFSAEIELTYRRTTLSRYRSGNQLSADEGDFASLIFMANVYYRFDTGGPLRPYVGFGLGFVEEIDLDLELTPGVESGFDDNGFAYQAMVGVEYAFDFGLFLFAEGRFFRATAFELRGENGSGSGATRVEADYTGFEARFGLGFRF